MNCNKCGSLCIKKGFQKNGQQKYLCKNCKCYKQENYIYKGCDPLINDHIIKLVKRSCGIRDISYITEISSTSVMKKICLIAENIHSPKSFPLYGDYEMDEMHTKIWKENKKTDVYIAYAIHKQSKEVVNFTIGSRDSETLSKTVNKILENYPKRIRTDKWVAYPGIIPSKIHTTTRRKINQIERYNLTLRTHLKRLGHNRLCHSKKIEMLECCLKIYFWG
jgi:insertion element IS1 protein InsB